MHTKATILLVLAVGLFGTYSAPTTPTTHTTLGVTDIATATTTAPGLTKTPTTSDNTENDDGNLNARLVISSSRNSNSTEWGLTQPEAMEKCIAMAKEKDGPFGSMMSRFSNKLPQTPFSHLLDSLLDRFKSKQEFKYGNLLSVHSITQMNMVDNVFNRFFPPGTYWTGGKLVKTTGTDGTSHFTLTWTDIKNNKQSTSITHPTAMELLGMSQKEIDNLAKEEKFCIAIRKTRKTWFNRDSAFATPMSDLSNSQSTPTTMTSSTETGHTIKSTGTTGTTFGSTETTGSTIFGSTNDGTTLASISSTIGSTEHTGSTTFGANKSTGTTESGTTQTTGTNTFGSTSSTGTNGITFGSTGTTTSGSTDATGTTVESTDGITTMTPSTGSSSKNTNKIGMEWVAYKCDTRLPYACLLHREEAGAETKKTTNAEAIAGTTSATFSTTSPISGASSKFVTETFGTQDSTASTTAGFTTNGLSNTDKTTIGNMDQTSTVSGSTGTQTTLGSQTTGTTTKGVHSTGSTTTGRRMNTGLNMAVEDTDYYEGSSHVRSNKMDHLSIEKLLKLNDASPEELGREIIHLQPVIHLPNDILKHAVPVQHFHENGHYQPGRHYHGHYAHVNHQYGLDTEYKQQNYHFKHEHHIQADAYHHDHQHYYEPHNHNYFPEGYDHDHKDFEHQDYTVHDQKQNVLHSASLKINKAELTTPQSTEPTITTTTAPKQNNVAGVSGIETTKAPQTTTNSAKIATNAIKGVAVTKQPVKSTTVKTTTLAPST